MSPPLYRLSYAASNELSCFREQIIAEHPHFCQYPGGPDILMLTNKAVAKLGYDGACRGKGWMWREGMGPCACPRPVGVPSSRGKHATSPTIRASTRPHPHHLHSPLPLRGRSALTLQQPCVHKGHHYIFPSLVSYNVVMPFVGIRLPVEIAEIMHRTPQI
jgi:hypothetical protein